jgi:hypothetical protein
MKPKFRSVHAFPLAAAIAALLALSSVRAGQIWNRDVLPTFTSAISFTGNIRNSAVNNLTADSIIGGNILTMTVVHVPCCPAALASSGSCVALETTDFPEVIGFLPEEPGGAVWSDGVPNFKSPI